MTRKYLVVVMMVMVEILRQLHRLLFGRGGGETGVVGLEHIGRIRNRVQKIAVACGGSKWRRLHRCGLSGVHRR